MTDDFETFREVGIAVQGIHRQLNLHTAIFAGAVVIACAVSGFFYNKLDTVAASTAKNEANIGALNDKMSELITKVDKISLKLKVASSADDTPLVSGADALKAAGFKVLDLKDVSPPAKAEVVQDIMKDDSWLAVTKNNNDFQKAVGKLQR